MGTSLNGTKWVCIDEDMEERGMTCTVVEGVSNSDWNGDNDIEIRYEDNSIAYMKLRRFMSRFRKL